MSAWFATSFYALMLSAGACVGFWLTYREALRKGADADKLLALSALAFAASLCGARATSWLLHHGLYAERPWWHALIFWDRGGMSFYGGLLPAVAVGLLYIRRRDLRAWDAADTLVVAWSPLLVSLRLGCFLNGCCFGRPTACPLGMVAGGSPHNVGLGIPTHPTQLYAAGAAAAIFALLWRLRRRRRFEGQLAVFFLVAFGLFRFLNEFVRGDTRIAWRFGELGVLGLNQLLSLVLIAIGALAGWRLAHAPPPSRGLR